MSNLTIQQFIGKDKHPGIERLFGYNQETWVKLLSHVAFTRILGVSKVPLVLFSQRIRTIASTRNNKARRKYILSLLEYTESVTSVIGKPSGAVYKMSSLTCWLSEVMGVLGFDRSTTDVTVRYVTYCNAPNLAAITVGDSKHFTSCLRSGVQHYASKLLKEGTVTKSELTLKWYRNNSYGAVSSAFSGCNSHYIVDEIKAFDAGEVFYVIVGNMVYEDHEGPRARARVHVVNGTELGTMYVVDDVYGDKLFVTNMYKELHTTYPGQVYSTKGSCVPDTVSVSSEGVNLDSYIDAYSDHLPGEVYRVINVTDFAPDIKLERIDHSCGDRWYLRNTGNGDSCLTRLEYKVEPSSSFVPNDEYINSIRDLFPSNYKRYYSRLQPDPMLTLIAAVSRHYNLPCVRCGCIAVEHLLVPGYSRVTLSGAKLVWEIRGYMYTLGYDYTFDAVSLTRHKSCSPYECASKKHIYNFKTNKWVDVSSTQFLYERRKYSDQLNHVTPYGVTRQTIHLIYKFMPKPNARVRTMPKL